MKKLILTFKILIARKIVRLNISVKTVVCPNNTLFPYAVLKVSVREDKGKNGNMTIRLYGPNTEYVINRERELQVSF